MSIDDLPLEKAHPLPFGYGWRIVPIKRARLTVVATHARAVFYAASRETRQRAASGWLILVLIAQAVVSWLRSNSVVPVIANVRRSSGLTATTRSVGTDRFSSRSSRSPTESMKVTSVRSR